MIKLRMTEILLLLFFFCQTSFAEQKELTIFHTNDIHSHYRIDKGPQALGGIARIATLLRRAREQSPHSILVDGGDWSEGQIYYNLDAGRTALEMMNMLNYDAAVIGNHDWLNGPDQLLKILKMEPPRFAVLGSNLSFADYPKKNELSSLVEPYRILKVNDLKVALIGVVTYEIIYDKYFAPVKIKEPFSIVKKLAKKLKNEDGVDVVVVLSHNNLSTDKYLASMPFVDVVVHAHDHARLAKPLEVEKNDKTAYVVNTGCWGFFVGKLNLLFDTETKKIKLKQYDLLQVDDTIPEDPTISNRVDNYEFQIKQKYGNVFNDKIAETKITINKEGAENIYGNLLTDAYRDFAGADVSFEQVALTSGVINQGFINTADIFNALAAIWSPLTNKAWTLKTFKMNGATIKRVVNTILGLAAYIPGGMISVSGINATYDPKVVQKQKLTYEKLTSDNPDDEANFFQTFEINGAPLDVTKDYLVAVPHGIYEALELINNMRGDLLKFSYTDFKDTQVEDWKVLQKYLVKNSPIQSSSILRGNRIISLKEDLGIFSDEISTRKVGNDYYLKVNLRNLGKTASESRVLNIRYDLTPDYFGDDPNPSPVLLETNVASIAGSGQQTIELKLALPDALLKAKKVPLYVGLNSSEQDFNSSNDWALTYLELTP